MTNMNRRTVLASGGAATVVGGCAQAESPGGTLPEPVPPNLYKSFFVPGGRDISALAVYQGRLVVAQGSTLYFFDQDELP